MQTKKRTIGKWVLYQYKLLPHRPRLFWHRLWVRKDEFHVSLHQDVRAMLVMDEEDRTKYINDLCCRRQKAHQRN